MSVNFLLSPLGLISLHEAEKTTASGAQANYKGILVNCRSGIHPNEETVQKMNDVLSPSARKGQSVDAIIAHNPELFGRYSRSTIYGWIEDGLFTAKKHDLPFAGTRRKPRKKPETKTNAKCRVGRTYADLLEWLKANPDVVPTEADTVIGSISGKVLFTFMVRNKLPLAFLRDAKTSQTFTRIINMLWDAASVTGWLVTYGATNRPLAKIWSMNIRKVNVGAS